MKHLILPLVLALGTAAPVMAGDASKGEAEFKKCKACHAIVAADGTEIVKGGKTGPNLFGVIGRTVGTEPDFAAYGDALKTIGAAGRVWDETALAAFVANPSAWVQEASGDPAAKSKMTFKLAKGGEDVAAYLSSLN